MPRSSEFDFREQHVVVTGGSNGIGLAIAEAFKNAQASVIITGTKQVSNDYDHDLSGFDYRSLDTGDAEAVSAFADSVDVVDVLVNCAGTALGPMEYQVDGWQRIIDVNLTGSMRLATDLLDKLSDRQGVVINIASMSSYAGFPHAPAYGASKTAIVSADQVAGHSLGGSRRSGQCHRAGLGGYKSDSGHAGRCAPQCRDRRSNAA